MSDCLDENSALELLDGRLASATRARVERHLESCDVCRELVVELAKVASEESHGSADTEPTALPLSSGLTHAGPYRIERQVGSGAAGTVYRAIDERTREVVALKLVTDPNWRARFGREVETLARLVHPGIVRYIAHGETPHGMYLVMEWLDGEDLEQCLRRGPLPWTLVRVLGLRLTAALAHAHMLGAVHRDLGPRNVFLPGGRVDGAKLLDFGLVRVRDGLERTASHAVLGTPFYMAPEQVKDPKSVDPRTDLFALGVVFFEALSGVRPFHGDDLFTVWLRIVDHPAPDLRTLTRGVPEPFIRLIEALLAKDPNGRPPSASAVHHALVQLESLAQSGQVIPYPPSVPRPTPVHPLPSPVQHPGFASGSGQGPGGIPAASHGPQQRRGSGVYVAAGVGVTALVAASAIAVGGARFLRRATGGDAVSDASSEPPSVRASASTPAATAKGTASPSKNDADEAPSGRLRGSSSSSTKRPPAPVVDAGVPAKKDPLPTPGEKFFCGGDSVENRRNGNYQPDPEMTQLEPVKVAGSCKAVLEDCVIGGTSSVMVLGEGQLTLRRCRVLGSVKLVGASPLLTLEGTTLPSAPTIVGKGRVVRR